MLRVQTMNNKELWILIASYACLCLIVILITGKWW
nr:MAG TPA: Insulin receptor trans-membrane segment [Caudoviricetes sp.]